MIKSTLLVMAIVVVYLVSSAHTVTSLHEISSAVTSPCNQDTALTNFVIATDVTVAVSGEVFSTQSILENSNVIFKTGSGATLAYGTMTGSLSGPSPGFQIFGGSTLTVELEDCTATNG